ncbi:MAG: hypothetical protein KME13_09165 [Myxacorys californica WJT36-NPBG1]|jgi:hypothetical protein|nr:hypothetical protein [Myxacorys californica WJT36-NPBG1]
MRKPVHEVETFYEQAIAGVVASDVKPVAQYSFNLTDQSGSEIDYARRPQLQVVKALLIVSRGLH